MGGETDGGSFEQFVKQQKEGRRLFGENRMLPIITAEKKMIAIACFPAQKDILPEEQDNNL